MCDEFMEVFNKLKKDQSLSKDELKYVEEAKVYIIKQRNRGDEFYHWKTYDDVKIYKNYDSISERVGYYKKGTIILNKEIRVSGLPDHCFKKN